MKNRLFGIIALVAIMALGFFGCGDNGDTHTHEWQWIETKAATVNEEGIETETCTKCGEIKDTRPIPIIPTIQQDFGVSLFGTYTATIETGMGTLFTSIEWETVLGKVVDAVVRGYGDGSGSNGLRFEGVFGDVVTIVVEKNPTGYTNYKVDANGFRTLYLNVDNLETIDLKLAIRAMNDKNSDNVLMVGKMMPNKKDNVLNNFIENFT